MVPTTIGDDRRGERAGGTDGTDRRAQLDGEARQDGQAEHERHVLIQPALGHHLNASGDHKGSGEDQRGPDHTAWDGGEQEAAPGIIASNAKTAAT